MPLQIGKDKRKCRVSCPLTSSLLTPLSLSQQESAPHPDFAGSQYVLRGPISVVWTAHLLAPVRTVDSLLTIPSHASEESKVPWD